MRKDVVSLILILILMQLHFSQLTIYTDTFHPNQVEKTSSNEISSVYTPHDPILILSDSQFALQGFPGSGTEEDPYRIENYEITSGTGNSCIAIADVNVHFLIQDCFLIGDNVESGIHIHGCGNDIIRNNIIVNCSRAIRLIDSYGFVISENDIERNTNSIIIANSHGNTITNNSCDGSQLGIGFVDSLTNTIFNNTISNMTIIGLNVQGSDYNSILNNTFISCSTSVIFEDSDSSDLIGNIFRHGSYGLLALTSRYNTINENYFENNTNHIFFSGSGNTGNAVSWNTFLPWSEQNAHDSTPDNHFFYNYWWDYNGTDGNGDGFGDTPYPISGSSYNSDVYPLIEPLYDLGPDVSGPTIVCEFNRPFIESGNDILVEADVVDISGVSSVTLSFRVNHSIIFTNWDDLNNITMDRNEFTYSTHMPAFPYGSLVEFFITAEDAKGNSAVSDTYLYRVVIDITEPTFPDEASWDNAQYMSTDTPLTSWTFRVNVSDQSTIASVTVHYEGSTTEESLLETRQLILVDESLGLWETSIVFEETSHLDIEIYFFAIDIYGNFNHSKTVHLIVDQSIVPTATFPPNLLPVLIGCSAALLVGVVIFFEMRERSASI